MRILIVTAMFPPIRTGTSFYSFNLAQALTNRGHDIKLVTVTNSESFDNEVSYEIIRIPALHFPLKNVFKHLSVCAFFPGNYTRLLNIARNHKSDVILLINHYLDIAFPAAFAARLLKIPLVVSVGTQILSINPFRDKILNIIDRLICGKILFRMVNRIVAWDNEIVRYLSSVHGKGILERTVIVQYGVNGNESNFLNYKHDYNSKCQILGIGSIIEQRNFMMLIHSFNCLLKRFPKLNLKIIGHVYYDAPVRLVKEMNLEDRVQFTGELSHEDVLKEIQNSLLFWGVPTGRYSGLGTAAIEAMLMGVPVVSNIPENLFGSIKIRDMEHFVYVDGLTVDSTVGRLFQLIENCELRERVGKGGRMFVENNLNWSIVAERIDKLLLEEINI